ncbi:hypothetical protein AZH43_17290 [Acinetobacter pragensis]|uniref:Uncharacterized protein n=1 Tax=Acinetobacter pragensis TaxID=1806892 RepID=A0A151XY95_9GAMM|nr:hypothetical protein AZH43_17290 [Acinetobacter pragensis]
MMLQHIIELINTAFMAVFSRPRMTAAGRRSFFQSQFYLFHRQTIGAAQGGLMHCALVKNGKVQHDASI